MEEKILTGAKLQEELDFVKRHAAAIGSQKIAIPDDYTPPPSERAKRPFVAEVPLSNLPEPEEEDVQGTSSTKEINITIKSLKPALTFSISASPTATIASLKSLLSMQESTAPAPDAQSWLLKGKALSDSKLLKEYDVSEGDTVHLRIKAGVPGATGGSTSNPVPTANETIEVAPSAPTVKPSVPQLDTSVPKSIPKVQITPTVPSPSHPSITLTESGPIQSSPATSPSMSRRNSGSGSPAHHGHRRVPSVSDEFMTSVAAPKLWKETFEVLQRAFPDREDRAVKVWEQWFESSKDWLKPGEIAKIREEVGLTAMGGI